MLTEPFAQAMVKLNKGQTTTTPVKSEFGYHIIKVVDSRKITIPSYDQLKPRIKARLEEQKWNQYQIELFRQANVTN